LINNPNRQLIEKYTSLGLIGPKSDDNADFFGPDDPIEIDDFETMVSKASGMNVEIATKDQYVHRDTAVTVLYKVFISRDEPKTSLGTPFIDIQNSDKIAYIDAAYNSALVTGNGKYFMPFNNISRSHAVILLDRFEKNSR
jgi:hypothetical protein